MNGLSNSPLFSKITGSVLQFRTGQRIDAGIHYSSRTMDLPNDRMIIETYAHGRHIHSELTLEGVDKLDFTIASDDSKIPNIRGRFLDRNYQESIINGTLPAQGLQVTGSLTMLNERSAISIKLLNDLKTNALVAVAQEKIDLITEDEFRAAIS